jgi:hypothetical protein
MNPNDPPKDPPNDLPNDLPNDPPKDPPNDPPKNDPKNDPDTLNVSLLCVDDLQSTTKEQKKNFYEKEEEKKKKRDTATYEQTETETSSTTFRRKKNSYDSYRSASTSSSGSRSLLQLLATRDEERRSQKKKEKASDQSSKEVSTQGTREPLSPDANSWSCPDQTVVLSTNVRDETNLPEWIAYHLVVGFSHIFVVDHLSQTPVRTLLQNAFAPEVAEQILSRVTVHRFTQETSSGMKFRILQNLCHPFYKKLNADWAIHLDADEYWNPMNLDGGPGSGPLVLPSFSGLSGEGGEERPQQPGTSSPRSLLLSREQMNPGAVQRFLARFHKDRRLRDPEEPADGLVDGGPVGGGLVGGGLVGQIGVNWLLFGSSYFDKQPPGLVLQNFTASSDVADLHVKSFVRPEAIRGQVSPHFAELHPGYRTVDVFGRPIEPSSSQKSSNIAIRFVGYAFQDNRHIPVSEFPCLINHYYCQSYEKYVERKLKKRRDDTGTFRKPVPAKRLHAGSFYDLQNEKFSFQSSGNCNRTQRTNLSVHFAPVVASLLLAEGETSK